MSSRSSRLFRSPKNLVLSEDDVVLVEPWLEESANAFILRLMDSYSHSSVVDLDLPDTHLDLNRDDPSLKTESEGHHPFRPLTVEVHLDSSTTPPPENLPGESSSSIAELSADKSSAASSNTCNYRLNTSKSSNRQDHQYQVSIELKQRKTFDFIKFISYFYPFAPIMFIINSPMANASSSGLSSSSNLSSNSLLSSNSNLLELTNTNFSNGHICLINPTIYQSAYFFQKLIHLNTSRIKRLNYWCFEYNHINLPPNPTNLNDFLKSLMPIINVNILGISKERMTYLKNEIFNESFNSWGLNQNELAFVGFIIIQYSLKACKQKHAYNHITADNDIHSTNNLNSITDEELLWFVLAVRNQYHENWFHGFRHAIDVLQAEFIILLSLHLIPIDNDNIKDYNYYNRDNNTVNYDIISSIIKPDDIVSLLISAIGHDLQHPGVTNDFLSINQTPLSITYNDSSILENLHSSSFNKLLKSLGLYNKMNWKLIYDSILATDMKHHFSYLRNIEKLIPILNVTPISPKSRRLRHRRCKESKSSSNKENTIEHDYEYKVLLCSLIIKCADISNVTRSKSVSYAWGVALYHELQEIEDLSIFLKNPQNFNKINNESRRKVQDREIDPRQIAKGQVFFIGTFAKELFKAMKDVIGVTFMYDAIEKNFKYWNNIIEIKKNHNTLDHKKIHDHDRALKRRKLSV